MKPEMKMAAGSWVSDPCYCDRVQSLNMNAIGAGGQAQQWYGTMTVTGTTGNNITISPDWTYWPVYPYPIPYTWPTITVNYPDNTLAEKVKILEEKVRELEKRAILDDATKSMREALDKFKRFNDLIAKMSEPEPNPSPPETPPDTPLGRKK